MSITAVHSFSHFIGHMNFELDAKMISLDRFFEIYVLSFWKFDDDDNDDDNFILLQ